MEVYAALNEVANENQLSNSGEYPWTRSTVLKYLSMTPASHLSDSKCVWGLFLRNRVRRFLAALEQFEEKYGIRFMPNEKMQMINIVPLQPVDVHIVAAFREHHCIDCGGVSRKNDGRYGR